MTDAKERKDSLKKRTGSRLMAVMALHHAAQLDQGEGAASQDLTTLFKDSALAADLKDEGIEGDADYLQELVRPFHQTSLTHFDDLIDKTLEKPWTSDRIESLLLAFLRAAAAELVCVPETPAPLVINEYVSLAFRFFCGKEPNLLRASLEKIKNNTADPEGASSDDASKSAKEPSV